MSVRCDFPNGPFSFLCGLFELLNHVWISFLPLVVYRIALLCCIAVKPVSCEHSFLLKRCYKHLLLGFVNVKNRPPSRCTPYGSNLFERFLKREGATGADGSITSYTASCRKRCVFSSPYLLLRPSFLDNGEGFGGALGGRRYCFSVDEC